MGDEWILTDLISRPKLDQRLLRPHQRVLNTRTGFMATPSKDLLMQALNILQLMFFEWNSLVPVSALA